MRSYRAMFVTGGALALWGLLAVSIAAAGGRDDHKDRDDHRDKDKEMSRAAVKRLVERSLPQWNRRVLNVPDGKRWVEEVDFSRILGALGEEPPPQDLPLGARQFRDELRTVRLDPGKGAIRYLTPAEKREREERTAELFTIYRALEAIATFDMTPRQWAHLDHGSSRYRVDEHLEPAYQWISKLREQWQPT